MRTRADSRFSDILGNFSSTWEASLLRSDSVAHVEELEGVLEKAAQRSHVVAHDDTNGQLLGGDKDRSFHSKFSPDVYNRSPELESDVEKDELTPESPENSSHSSVEFPRSLPSTPYASSFSVEEARLRFSLGSNPYKNHLNLSSNGSLPSFTDDVISRRYSFQESMQDGKSQLISHSPPSSPTSESERSFRSPSQQSIHDLSYDEDQRNLIPRMKEGLYFCHLCSFSGSTQADFDNHMAIHFEHICPHCDYKSRTEGRLKRHIKDFHTDDPDGGYNRTMPGRPKVFRCKQCEYSTTEKIDFWTHSRSHIKEDKLLQCPRCPFVTEYKHHLEYHLRNHFGSKPFKCPKCNYACVNKSMLNSHMKSHTNVYQYRCADCTYATKYCHSLKLHLRKYNHKPAAVLNSDGSLPQGMDASASGLSLLAKRGPPRGPRGPRKDKLESGPSPVLPMPPTSLGPLLGMPGMMSPFWPMLHNQMQGRLPHPLGFGQHFNPSLAGLQSLGLKMDERKLSPGSVPKGAPVFPTTPFKCNFCSFIGTSREVLTSHVMKVHATENQDLFSMFGLSSESLLEDENKRMAALGMNLKSMVPIPDPNNAVKGLDLANIKKERMDPPAFRMKSPPSEFDRVKLSPFSHLTSKLMNDNSKDEGIDILKQMTLKFGSGPVDLKRKLPMTSASSILRLGSPLSHLPATSNRLVPAVSLPSSLPIGYLHTSSLPVGSVPASSSSDSPLDLTKPRTPPDFNSSPVMEQFKSDDGEHSSGENSVYSNEVSSPQPRKRSRKGKAFKLDTFCMQLQEKQGMYEGEEDEGEQGEKYRPELLPEDAYRKELQTDDNSEGQEQEHVKQEEKEMDENNALDEEDNILSEDMTQKKNEENANENDEVNEFGMEKVDRMIDEKNTDRCFAADVKTMEADNEDEAVVDLSDVNDEVEENEKVEDKNDKHVDLMSSTFPSEDIKVPSPSGFGNSRRKPIPAAIQRGADIAWKILNDPGISDPTLFLNNGNNGHKLEMTPLDKKLWIEAPECTNHQQKTEKGEYECPHCQISFGDCIMYTMHMGYHGYKDPYKCNMCGDTCKDRVEFFLHIARAAHN